MQTTVRQIAQAMPFYHTVRNWWRQRTQQRLEQTWYAQGCSTPPPHLVKQKALRDYAQRHQLKIFVETGTFLGDMVEAMKPYFDKIYSIELDHRLYVKAKARFARQNHITLIEGDSGVKLAEVMREFDQPALFWLDGHYSAGNTARGREDSPILQELDHILASPEPGHVILIDDARCFASDPLYPSLQEIETFVTQRRPHAQFKILNDIIRIEPASANAQP
jgi:hypothetical protein